MTLACGTVYLNKLAYALVDSAYHANGVCVVCMVRLSTLDKTLHWSPFRGLFLLELLPHTRKAAVENVINNRRTRIKNR